MDPIRYEVDLSARLQHLVRVTMTVPADLTDGLRLVVPTWTPGSYVERDYVHHLQSLSAVGADGAAVALRPDGRTAFVSEDAGAGPLTIDLEWYANDLTVRTNHVDDHHALLVPPATFPFVDGAEDRPHEVLVHATDGHEVHGLLPRRGDGTFAADDYLHLVDSAFEVGVLPTIDFEVDGIPHRWVHASLAGEADLERIATDVGAIAAVARDVVGGSLPIESYTFLCVGGDEANGGGGLEHRDGSVLMLPVLTDATDKGIRRTRSLIAHEYFHLWNVKRLVPAELTPLRLDRPQHTTALWVAEGWTAHYDGLLPVRAGLTEPKQWLEAVRDDLRWVRRSPGARAQSVTDASWHAWTGLYVRDENSVNAGTNYYTHGSVLAACLDLWIRDADPTGDGLDEAMRLLWNAFGHDQPHGYPTRGYTHADVVAALSEAAGSDATPFVEAHVTGTATPPLEDLLDVAGLRVVEEAPDPDVPDLGVTLRDTDHGSVVTSALRDRPAWRGGVTGGDRILAIDGLLLGRGELQTALRTTEPGQVVTLAVARGPRLLSLEVELGASLPDLALRPVDDPSDTQREVFARWTGSPLDDLD